MQKALEGLPDQHLVHYMDDVAVHHTSLDSLILLTEGLLYKFQTFRLKINPDKTSLLLQNVTLLGHEVNETGICMPQKYIDKIQALTTPKTPKQVQTFLGLANWCSRFFHTSLCYKTVNNLRE